MLDPGREAEAGADERELPERLTTPTSAAVSTGSRSTAKDHVGCQKTGATSAQPRKSAGR